MKRLRYEDVHRASVRWPNSAFRYIGIDNEGETKADYEGEVRSFSRPSFKGAVRGGGRLIVFFFSYGKGRPRLPSSASLNEHHEPTDSPSLSVNSANSASNPSSAIPTAAMGLSSRSGGNGTRLGGSMGIIARVRFCFPSF